MTRFCISVPVGAWHPFLPAALESLFHQQADVAVAFLDASGDPQVEALADRYAGRLAYRRTGKDAGQSDAIIEGWANAPGDVLGWLNADDILSPGALARVAARFAAEPALDMVYGHSAILDAEGRMVGYHWAVEPPGPRIFEAGVISQPSCFFRRAACERAGGLDRGLHYTMDWDLWIRLYKAGAQVGFLDAPLSYVLWGEETKTASFGARRQEELRRIITTYAPAEKQEQIFRAFAIHARLGQLKPDFVRRRLTRWQLSRGPSVYGVRADGFVAERARLTLCHYEPSPKQAARLQFDGAAEGVEAWASAPAKVVAEKTALLLRFEAPIPAGVEISVELQAPERGARFQHLAWV